MCAAGGVLRLETPKDKLKHKWVKRFELDKYATGDNWTVCKRCGIIMRADKKNKDKPCPGLVKVTTRKKHGKHRPRT